MNLEHMSDYQKLLPYGSFIAGLKELRDTLPKEVHCKFDCHVRTMVKDLSTDVGGLLHNLDEGKHKIAQVRKMVRAFPSALLCKNYKGWMPIQSAARSKKSVMFVPLLAEEGLAYNVGGKNGRGGLLVEYSTLMFQPNVIMILNSIRSVDGSSSLLDKQYLGVLKMLKKMKLLKKKDLRQYDLLHCACEPLSKERFQYLIKWDKSALEKYEYMCEPFLHASITSKMETSESFAMTLSAGMRHFPNEMGFLFKHNRKGETALKVAIQFYGKEKTFDIITKSIPPSGNYPILHHAIQYAPDHLNDFAIRYPSAAFERDDRGRLFHHVALQCGKTLLNDPMFILQLTDSVLEENDPISGLLPFMIAARTRGGDLSTVFHLIRRNPVCIQNK